MRHGRIYGFDFLEACHFPIVGYPTLPSPACAGKGCGRGSVTSLMRYRSHDSPTTHTNTAPNHGPGSMSSPGDFNSIGPLYASIMLYQGTFAASCKNKDSQTSPITPATIAASAILKTYHSKVQVGAVI